jgi:hypothetical protein
MKVRCACPQLPTLATTAPEQGQTQSRGATSADNTPRLLQEKITCASRKCLSGKTLQACREIPYTRVGKSPTGVSMHRVPQRLRSAVSKPANVAATGRYAAERARVTARPAL